MQAQQFTVFKHYTPKGNAANHSIAQIAIFKTALLKSKTRQVRLGKNAIKKSTIFIFRFGRHFCRKILVFKGLVNDIFHTIAAIFR
jgi:hypothetical protein